MSGSLFDNRGIRKYLVPQERRTFVLAAREKPFAVATFCETLAISGARLSEVLSLTREGLDFANGALVFRTLKQREKIIFRAVPVPPSLITRLRRLPAQGQQRPWNWGRTTAWAQVKAVMRSAQIDEVYCKPKALRHAFAIHAGKKGVPLNIVQRWLGHSRIETTAIYSAAVGDEERNLARRFWIR
jgi:integrase/recombinase XerD